MKWFKGSQDKLSEVCQVSPFCTIVNIKHFIPFKGIGREVKRDPGDLKCPYIGGGGGKRSRVFFDNNKKSFIFACFCCLLPDTA